ncbi:MAG TPA: F0F1 ATP synthase subunit A [Kineosporiaceae bacterium]|nr:F0F1 ATP synthase subunit A [Kineosporiaceae bacterium]
MSTLLAASDDGFEAPTSADFWQPLFGTHGNLAITRSSIVILISVAVLCLWLVRATRRLSLVPGKMQFAVEGVYGLVRNSIGRDVLGSRDFLRFVPLLFSMFTLILLNNLFGVLPPVQFPTMSRFAFPLVLALIVFVVYHAVGIRRVGLGTYLGNLIPKGVPKAVLPLLIPLEYVTYFITRPATLALRLWGNMFAGHIIVVLFITGGEYLLLHSDVIGYKPVGVVSYIAAFVMTVFEILVQFLQAYVFTLLTALYIAGSLVDEH